MPEPLELPRRPWFLAIHEVPPGRAGAALQTLFDRVAVVAARRGQRAIASFYSPERRRAYTLVEDDDEDEVRRTCEEAGLRVVDVLHGDLLAQTLLEEPAFAARASPLDARAEPELAEAGVAGDARAASPDDGVDTGR